MIRKILYPAISAFLGMALLFFPGLIGYLRTDGFLFDLASFLGDYPWFRFPFGTILLLVGAAGVVFGAGDTVRENTDFVIQQSGDGDFGNAELRFPRWLIGSKNPTIYRNLASIKRHDECILRLDRDRIKDFYDGISTHKRMVFLAVALFPLLVYGGYVVGNSGKRITYFHYDRIRAKSVWLRNGKRTAFFERRFCGGNPMGPKRLICFSVSHQIDEAAVERQFPETKIEFYALLKPGTEAIHNLSDLNGLADDMRTAIASVDDAQSVGVLLSCSAELCFAFGQRLNSPGLPLVSIYNFDRRCSNMPWNWAIVINE